jgi:hypothetical protein
MKAPMKSILCILGVIAGVFTATTGFGQAPPPNDNYSNRTVLSGTDITFSGTLAGATVEIYREESYFDAWFGSGAPTKSVWWSWTAPASTTLTLQMISSSLPVGVQPFRSAFAIYTATNGSPDPSGLILPPLGMQNTDFRLGPLTICVPVTAGTEYEIQLVGGTSADYTARLIASNTPIIVQQPLSRTVSSNSTALFYVASAGTNQAAFTFQWLHDDQPLDGETAPELALSNIDSTMAGAYTVIVSNAAGFTVSAPAILTVSQSNVPVFLSPYGMDPNVFSFSLAGESGRGYQIQSSTDLMNWAPDLEFPLNPFRPNATSVIITSNSTVLLTVTNSGFARFFRASPYVPAPATTDECDNHLQQIRVAKLLWSRDVVQASPGIYGVSLHATPTVVDLTPYFPRHMAPFCPFDPFATIATSYTFNDITTEPLCIIIPILHNLQEPR